VLPRQIISAHKMSPDLARSSLVGRTTRNGQFGTKHVLLTLPYAPIRRKSHGMHRRSHTRWGVAYRRIQDHILAPPGDCLAISPCCGPHATPSKLHRLQVQRSNSDVVVVSSGLQTLVVGEFSCKSKGLASLFLSQHHQKSTPLIVSILERPEGLGVAYLALANTAYDASDWRGRHPLCKFRSYQQGESGLSLPRKEPTEAEHVKFHKPVKCSSFGEGSCRVS
jgi:hypothetical protein